MAYKVVDKRVRGKLRKVNGVDGPVAIVDVEDGPFDFRLGETITQIGYSTTEELLEDIGPQKFREAFEEEKVIEVTVPIRYTTWER